MPSTSGNDTATSDIEAPKVKGDARDIEIKNRVEAIVTRETARSLAPEAMIFALKRMQDTPPQVQRYLYLLSTATCRRNQPVMQ